MDQPSHHMERRLTTRANEEEDQREKGRQRKKTVRAKQYKAEEAWTPRRNIKGEVEKKEDRRRSEKERGKERAMEIDKMGTEKGEWTEFPNQRQNTTRKQDSW